MTILRSMFEAKVDEGTTNTHLVTIGDLVLAVEVVPDVDHTIHPRDEEHSRPRRAKAPAR